MSDVETLRAAYKEATGKNAFNGWDAAELQKRIDEAAGNATEPATKVEATPATAPEPYPSQADLDEMRERSVAGGQTRRDMKTSAKPVDYETR
ncbi:hypothetical protein [Enterovirga rhinocerotis]|uniref:Uncharacterized protein n=1 Tax=Enterovirga rhinocerotis TaxID=1339210 RepID=A0A4R7BXJ0_9HYPH|nr:hypothetical protein [Enterovirga rhinocerotis]TDR90301.1 hypothetical protein EV668_3147 [Enterovirga rhinocerotis]